jgi:hypothetical protein
LFSTSKREVGEDLDIVEEEDEEIEEDEDESHNGEETQAMENCFQAMVDILAKQVVYLPILINIVYFLLTLCEP